MIDKNELIEEFGVHFEKIYQIPPLAGRILSMLIVDGCKSGLTFEQLIDKVQASKSSVSTNLNLLLKMGKIEYFTIIGDRKKYFKPAPLSQRLQNYLKVIESEIELIRKLMVYRSHHMSCANEEANFQNLVAYFEHVNKLEALLNQTIEKFKTVENNINNLP